MRTYSCLNREPPTPSRNDWQAPCGKLTTNCLYHVSPGGFWDPHSCGRMISRLTYLSVIFPVSRRSKLLERPLRVLADNRMLLRNAKLFDRGHEIRPIQMSGRETGIPNEAMTFGAQESSACETPAE